MESNTDGGIKAHHSGHLGGATIALLMAKQNASWQWDLSHPALTLIFSVLLLPALTFTSAQQASPLEGQGLPPMTGNCTQVYLSVLLYKLLAVDQNLYQFEAIMDVYVTWQDPRADKYLLAQVRKLDSWLANETALDRIGGLCQESSLKLTNDICLDAVLNIRQNDNPCNRRCRPGSVLCCDEIWMPGFDLYNAITFSQDRFASETINVVDGAVSRMVRIYGRFTTPMSFRKFPIDSQDLQVIFTLQPGTNQVCVVESALSKNSMVLPLASDSDELSTWDIKFDGLKWNDHEGKSPVNFSNISVVPHKDDPLPITKVSGLSKQVSVMVITINRQFRYYVWNLILPVVVTVVLAFVTFLIAPKYIEARLSTSVTLMVALAALQYTISSQLPSVSYLTSMHQLVLMSYLMVTLTNVESLIVYFLVRDDFPRREEDPDYSRRLAESRGALSLKLDDADGEPNFSETSQNNRSPRPLGKPLEERIAEKIVPRPVVSWFQLIRTHPFKAYRLATHLDRIALATFPTVYIVAVAIIFSG